MSDRLIFMATRNDATVAGADALVVSLMVGVLRARPRGQVPAPRPSPRPAAKSRPHGQVPAPD